MKTQTAPKRARSHQPPSGDSRRIRSAQPNRRAQPASPAQPISWEELLGQR